MADELPDVPADLLMEDDSTELPPSRSSMPAMENLKEVRACLLHCPSPSLHLQRMLQSSSFCPVPMQGSPSCDDSIQAEGEHFTGFTVQDVSSSRSL